MTKENKVHLIDLEDAKDKLTGAKAMLEIFCLSEVIDEKYTFAFELISNSINSVEDELSNTITKLQNKGS